MRKVFDKVHKHVETHFVEAVLGKSHAVFVLFGRAPDFTTPQFKLIEQLVERIVTELKPSSLLDPVRM